MSSTLYNVTSIAGPDFATYDLAEAMRVRAKRIRQGERKVEVIGYRR